MFRNRHAKSLIAINVNFTEPRQTNSLSTKFLLIARDNQIKILKL